MTKVYTNHHIKQPPQDCGCSFCQQYGVHNINLSGVGNLKISVEVSKMKNGKGTIHLQQVTSENSAQNLKKGGREILTRHTLTGYAKRQIRDAGSMLKWMVEHHTDVYSTLMTTLTYGRAVPDHKTAKKHLNAFLTRCRQKGYLKHYVWVAQLQTGKRSTEKGIESYRAKNGAAIHFHILHLTYKGSELQLENAQKSLRAIWKGIVNKWEKNAGFQVQNIGGVDVTPVYNASNYVSRYISNESETIIGNMWNMSAEMRKMIERETQTTEVDKRAFYAVVKNVSAKRLYKEKICPTTKEPKRERIREATHHTISFPMWNDTPIIITDSVDSVLNDIGRIERNNKKTSGICNVQTAQMNLSQKTNNRDTVVVSVERNHFTPVN